MNEPMLHVAKKPPLPNIKPVSGDDGFNGGLLHEYTERAVDMSCVAGKPIIFVLGLLA